MNVTEIIITCVLAVVFPAILVILYNKFATPKRMNATSAHEYAKIIASLNENSYTSPDNFVENVMNRINKSSLSSPQKRTVKRNFTKTYLTPLVKKIK